MQTFIRILMILALTQVAMADSIYRYENEDGKIVFTDTPPDRKVYKVYKPKQLFVMTHRAPTIHASFYNLATRGKISPMIQNLAQIHEMDPYLVEAVVKAESDYDPMAISRAGAQGLMQIMPLTGVSLGLIDPFDAEQNLTAGIKHLKKLMSKYSNNVDLALAAYNAGEMSVSKYNGVPPYPETVDYIQKIKKYYSQFSVQSSNSSKQDAAKPVPYL